MRQVGQENHLCTWHYLGNERSVSALGGAGGAFELGGGVWGVLELPVGGGEQGSPLGAQAGDGAVGELG